jgi:hypothetical protein
MGTCGSRWHKAHNQNIKITGYPTEKILNCSGALSAPPLTQKALCLIAFPVLGQLLMSLHS